MQNHMVSTNYSYQIIIICLHAVIWHQVLQSNTNNLYTDSLIWFDKDYLMAYQLFKGYLILKFNWFVNVWL